MRVQAGDAHGRSPPETFICAADTFGRPARAGAAGRDRLTSCTTASCNMRDAIVRTRIPLKLQDAGRCQVSTPPAGRVWQRLALALAVALPVLAIPPWLDLQDHAHWANVAWVPFVSPPVRLGDVLRNVLLFAPLGAAVAANLRSSAVSKATALALLVSVSGEFSQLYSHTRFPSTTDVAVNVTAAAAAAWAVRRRISHGKKAGGAPTTADGGRAAGRATARTGARAARRCPPGHRRGSGSRRGRAPHRCGCA